MSVQEANIPSALISTCPFVVSKSDNILTYQPAYVVVGPRNKNPSPPNCFPDDYSLSYVYTKRQVSSCCNNSFTKKYNLGVNNTNPSY